MRLPSLVDNARTSRSSYHGYAPFAGAVRGVVIMSRIRLIIAGSRKWPWPNYLKQAITFYLGNYQPHEIEIICGEAAGPDSWGREWAEERGIRVTSFPADWDQYGNGAGYLRNKEMAEYGTHLLAFWNGESKGTQHMVNLAVEYGLKIRVLNLLKIKASMEPVSCQTVKVQQTTL